MVFNGKEWVKKQSLTAKLGISILGSVLCGVIALLAFFEQHSSPILASHITEIAEKSLQKSASSLVETAIEIEQATETLKNNLSKFSTDDVSIFRNLMQSTVQTMDYKGSNFGSVWIYVFEPESYKTGNLYTAENKDGSFAFNKSKLEDLYASYPWFKEVPKEEEIFWTEPYVDVENENKPLVTTCIIPFKFKGAEDFNGLVAISIYLDTIQQTISEFQFQEEGKFLLVSNRGLLIVDPYPEAVLKKTIYDVAREWGLPQLAQIGQKMLVEEKNGHMVLKVPNFDEPIIFFYTSIPHIKWGMGLVFPQNQFLAPIRSFQVQVMVFMLLVLIILFALISWICHYSTKPLLDLSKIAEQYGQGDFSAELPKSYSSDEIGIVSRAFRKMRGNLLHLIEDEKKIVADRQKNISELEIAQNIQQSALPTNFPISPNFEIYALMDPAQKVGGDFYDFFYTDKNHLVILVADVSGKGIPAALYMMTVKSLIKTAAQTNCSVTDIFSRVNDELCAGNDNMFLTAFLAKIDINSGEVEYINAGHNPPFLKLDDKYQEMSLNKNMVLGAMDDIKFKSEKLILTPGSRIFLYTDGVTEAQNQKGEFFAEERLEAVLQECNGSAEETLLSVYEEVQKFAGGAEQSDDITMLEFIFNGSERNVLAVKADDSETGKVIEFLEQDMLEKNLDRNIQSNVLVAAGEAFSNIASYAYKSGGTVLLKTKVEGDWYRLIFKDRGKEFNPLLHKDPEDLTQSVEQRKIGGLGIYMIKQMADMVEYEYINGCNILCIGINTKGKVGRHRKFKFSDYS